MEALYSPAFAKEVNDSRQLPDEEDSYLAQSEMRAFIQNALDLGWTLIAYEADFTVTPPNLSQREEISWREEMQARNLTAALEDLAGDTKLLVWCGNNHHTKALVPISPDHHEESWALMGYRFRSLSGIDPFVIDQGATVVFPGIPRRPKMRHWLEEVTPTLTAFGGTAGFLKEEAPPCFSCIEGDDACVISIDNEVV